MDHSEHLKDHFFYSFFFCFLFLQRKRPLKMCSAEIKARKVSYFFKNHISIYNKNETFRSSSLYSLLYYM